MANSYTINTGAGVTGASYSVTGATTVPSNGYLTSTGSWNGISGGGSITVNPMLTTNVSNTSITVKGDAEFEGDIKVDGKSLRDWMAIMEKRLAILVPDPKKLKKYEALQKAYNHYKMLEALCDTDDEDDK